LQTIIIEIWKEYSKLNSEGIKQASQLMDIDLNSIGDIDGQFGFDDY
jgi:hypothetical protein